MVLTNQKAFSVSYYFLVVSKKKLCFYIFTASYENLSIFKNLII